MRAAGVAREIDAEEPPSKRPALAAHRPSDGDATAATETTSALSDAAATAHSDAGSGVSADDAAGAGAGETKEEASKAAGSGATCKPDDGAAEAISSDRAAADKDMFETLACPICQEVGVTRRMMPTPQPPSSTLCAV